MQERTRYRASLFLAVFLAGGMLAPVLHPLSHVFQAAGHADNVHAEPTKPGFDDERQHSHRTVVCASCGHVFVKTYFRPAPSPVRLHLNAVLRATHTDLASATRLTLRSRGPPSSFA